MVEVRHRRRGIEVTFDGAEGQVLASVCRDVADLLRDEPAPEQSSSRTDGLPSDDELARMVGLDPTGPTEAPEDPVLRRLLPDAYDDQHQAEAAEYRRLTEGELRSTKVGALEQVATTAEAGGVVRLDGDQARVWLQAINDVRLAIGTRLDVTEDWYDDAVRLADDDPQRLQYVIYDWLSGLQEGLVRAVMRGS